MQHSIVKLDLNILVFIFNYRLYINKIVRHN